jgi:AraC-like DNA-binding protein
MLYPDAPAEKLQAIIDYCRRIDFTAIEELLFAYEAPAGVQVHGIPRLSVLFDGDMTFELYRKNSLQTCTLSAPAIYYCTRDGYLYSPTRNQLQTAVSFCYYPRYIRISAVDTIGKDDGWNSIFAIHTNSPLSAGGTLLADAFETLYLQHDTAVARQVLNTLWEQTLQELSANSLQPGTRNPSLWQEINQYLHTPGNYAASRETIARTFGISTSYVSKLCRQYAGCTFGELSEKYKMQHAAMLLQVSDLSIKEISSRCGFGYRPYFDRRFKQFYRRTPADYRKIKNGCEFPQKPQPDK